GGKAVHLPAQNRKRRRDDRSLKGRWTGSNVVAPALRHLSLPEDIGVRKPEPQRYSRSPTTCYVRYSLPWVILCCRETARWSTSTGEILDAMRSSKKGVRVLPTASRRTWTSKACTACGSNFSGVMRTISLSVAPMEIGSREGRGLSMPPKHSATQ